MLVLLLIMEGRLQKFARVVETGSFTKAAVELHTSQPALTTAVQKLERELKTELLVRRGHAFDITEAGKIAYEAALELSTQTQNLRQRISQASNEKITLNLGMIDSMADLLFVHANNLSRLEQHAHLSLTIDNSSRLTHYVEQNRLDLALVAKPTSTPATLTVEPVGDEPLVLVTQPAHAEQVAADLSRGQLPYFLSYNQQSQTHQLIAYHLKIQNIAPKPSFYSTSPEIMLQILLRNQATAVLPYLLVRSYIEHGELVQVPLGDASHIARSIVAVHRTGRSLSEQGMHVLTQTSQLLARLQRAADY
jgi:DNA-binding transcriptional LysR family regulator